MEITILGTGNAAVTKCYNTCFTIKDNDQYLLVDGGGGNKILEQLEKASINWKDIRHIFVTHKHVDHIMGIMWLVRFILQSIGRGSYDGDAYLYAHKEVINIIKEMADLLLVKKYNEYLGKVLHLITLEDRKEIEIIGNKVIPFDIQSTKAKQYGFTMYYGDNKKLTCCGDEPYNKIEEPYAKDSDILLHEAFCLYSEKDKFKPYEKNHSTAKDAAIIANQLNVKNLILYHTEDKNIVNRKSLYTNEAKAYYNGNIYVPDDLEIININ